MHPWRRGLTAGLLCVSLSLAGARAQSVNLLRNPTFTQGGGQTVTDWLFSTWNLDGDPAQLEQYEWGTEETGDSRALFFSTENTVKGHMWWQQAVAAVPGESYKLKVSVKSALEAKKYGGPRLGIFFLGENDKWLGIQEIKNLEANTGEDWITVEETVTAPEDAVKIGVRLGAMFDGVIHISFKDVEFGPARNE